MRILLGIRLMRNRGAQNNETAHSQLESLAARAVSYMPLQHLDGARTIDAMLLEPGGSLHGDQKDSKV